MNKTIVILGPTASGKTEFSLKIVNQLKNNKHQYNIVNSDSCQFWGSLSFLTCSPTKEEKQQANHLLFNYKDGDFKPSLGWWCNEIKQISHKIIVGGNCFYIYNLLKGIPNISIEKSIESHVKSIEKPYEILKKINPNTKVHFNDKYRVFRHLCCYFQTGKFFEDIQDKYQEDLFIIQILPPKDILKDRIFLRLKNNLDMFINDVHYTKHYDNYKTIIGYQEIRQFLSKNCTKDELFNNILQQTLRYAKHQYTFCKKIPFDLKIHDITQDINHIVF